ncbi:acyl-CoA dehydrogenase/oxidase [Phlyctochytrium arcticum]|nr:acyl-CoA dehydrogenase/oxidase [Phlyctochytrium arcticum]
MSVFQLSERVQKLKQVLEEFVEFECIPAEKIHHAQLGAQGSADRWKVVPPIIEQLKARARSLGLWNLFLPSYYPESPGLTNLEYATLCEIMGRTHLAAEACNCSAPDTGNMEVFAKYGTPAQKKQWLEPLMDGKIRSAFAMTEPAVASSDATNIELEIRRDGDEYIVNGRKWWISGAGDPRCAVYLVMGKNDPKNPNKHAQQSVIIVPATARGITIVRPMQVFGYDDAPHGHMEMVFDNVRVPASNMILGEGRGFEIIQGRLGPGRIHHCMRAIGIAERALEYHLLRATNAARTTFGKTLAQHGKTAHDVAASRLEIDQARLLVLRAAATMDAFGPKKALREIAMAKIVVPNMTLSVIDRAIQAHGAAGVSQDLPLAYMYSSVRTLRIADGPDEVHTLQMARQEFKRADGLRKHHERQQQIERALIAKL